MNAEPPQTMLTPDEFEAAVTGLVAHYAPRVFAVVQEYGPKVDARIAGWGLAHETHVDVIGTENTVHLGGAHPEDVLPFFRGNDLVTARIVWPAVSG